MKHSPRKSLELSTMIIDYLASNEYVKRNFDYLEQQAALMTAAECVYRSYLGAATALNIGKIINKE